jgi:perosamine synthetase
MPRIKAAALDHQLALIEDASQSLGATLDGKPTGSFGDVSCLSFNANKTVAGPGGGMLLTDRPKVAQRARHLACQARSGPGYIHDEVGYNYRLSNLQAAVILGQMERLPEILAAKRAVAAAYASVLADLPGVGLMPTPEGANPSWWLWTLYVSDRRRLEAALYASGIESRPLWQPLHVSPAHGGYCTGTGRVALWLWHNCLSLPSSPGLGVAEAERIAQIVREFLLTSGKQTD